MGSGPSDDEGLRGKLLSSQSVLSSGLSSLLPPIPLLLYPSTNREDKKGCVLTLPSSLRDRNPRVLRKRASCPSSSSPHRQSPELPSGTELPSSEPPPSGERLPEPSCGHAAAERLRERGLWRRRWEGRRIERRTRKGRRRSDDQQVESWEESLWRSCRDG